jgi:hypothetical protein
VFGPRPGWASALVALVLAAGVAVPQGSRAASVESTAAGAAEPDDSRPVDGRPVDGPTAVAWPSEHGDTAKTGRAKTAGSKPPPPRPSKTRSQIDVAIGLSPEAPGSKAEKDLQRRLEASVRASTDPPTRLRRLRPGAGTPRDICRARRDDLVIMIGYVPDREDPVVLAHDCRLDAALDLRAVTSVDEPALVSVLWDEHDELIRQGVRERRRTRPLGRKARVALVAGVALVVVGVAVGVLVASALRDERVVLKVGP